MFVTNWISPTKIQKISEITNFFRHYFLSRTEVVIDFICEKGLYINVFPTEKDPFGQIVSLNKFAEDLSILLEDYE